MRRPAGVGGIRRCSNEWWQLQGTLCLGCWILVILSDGTGASQCSSFPSLDALRHHIVLLREESPCPSARPDLHLQSKSGNYAVQSRRGAPAPLSTGAPLSTIDVLRTMAMATASECNNFPHGSYAPAGRSWERHCQAGAQCRRGCQRCRGETPHWCHWCIRLHVERNTVFLIDPHPIRSCSKPQECDVFILMTLRHMLLC